MTEPSGGDALRRRRRRWIAVTAALVGLTTVVPLSGSLLAGIGTQRDPPVPAATSTGPAPPAIKPLVVRPVIQAVQATADQCPQLTAGPPSGTLQMCDLDKTALYTLGPEAIQLQLTQTEALLSPITRGYFVQVSMTPESAQAFGDFTNAQIGKQVAFVRGGLVISAPKIDQRIDGETLQLSGELTEQQSEDIARMLRDEA